MKVFTVNQIRDLDQFTIVHEPISSLDLMERAAFACVDWIAQHLASYSEAVVVCGPGNNGGDGLAIARLLSLHGWKITVLYHEGGGKASPDFLTNLERAGKVTSISLHQLKQDDPLPPIPENAMVIDALFGSGLTRPLSSPWSDWIMAINLLPHVVISIDIPSGLPADRPVSGSAVFADFTLGFEVPKRAFFIPENDQYVGEWVILPIGLDQAYLDEMETDEYMLTESDIAALLNMRGRFDHKGVFGHALIIAGSFGKAGAAILCGKAALRSGTGLVTVHVPGKLNPIIQGALPEAMADTDEDQLHFTGADILTTYSAIGVGCGLGVHDETIEGLKKVFQDASQPLVLDADAINALALNKALLSLIPENTILTPHLKEFERVFGVSGDHYTRLEKLRSASMKHRIIIVLKGAHSAIATPDGHLYFNTTGNPGMATAGSGDVLTGIIAGLLAQQYVPEEAAILGVYLHGLAGDYAAEAIGYEAMIASDIIEHMSDAFNHLHEV